MLECANEHSLHAAFATTATISRQDSLRFLRYAIPLRSKARARRDKGPLDLCLLPARPAPAAFVRPCTASASTTSPPYPRQPRARAELAEREKPALRARTPSREFPRRWLRCSACSTGLSSTATATATALGFAAVLLPQAVLLRRRISRMASVSIRLSSDPKSENALILYCSRELRTLYRSETGMLNFHSSS